jgi:NAD binding domain of 6-phosphogluconate dehydrogenase
VAIADTDETTARRQGDNVINIPVTNLDKLATQVGFIGLGLMGSRLALRLHSTGWNIRAWNRSPQSATQINKEGIAIAPFVADLVAGSDVILSSLANDEAVRSVYLDKGGVFSTAKPDTVKVPPLRVITSLLSARCMGVESPCAEAQARADP